MKIIKNFLPSDLIVFLHNYYLSLPHFYGHKSIPTEEGGKRFYTHYLSNDDPLTKYICIRVKEAVSKDEPLGFIRAYFNVQHAGMEGSFHDDDGENTILLMISDTSPGEGCFEYIERVIDPDEPITAQSYKVREDDKIKKIPFVQNTLIMFNSKFLHRGRAPKKGVRITLAFKTKKVD
tara:strand:- start:341 stop:874 length:534 start_codon:yes stop_codon:yes gene_type:complete